MEADRLSLFRQNAEHYSLRMDQQLPWLYRLSRSRSVQPVSEGSSSTLPRFQKSVGAVVHSRNKKNTYALRIIALTVKKLSYPIKEFHVD